MSLILSMVTLFRGSGRCSAQAIFQAEAKEELQHLINLSCSDNGINLYRRLQRQGYY